MKKVDEPLEQRNDSSQPLSPRTSNAIIEQTLGTRNNAVGTTRQEATQTVTPVASGVTTLGVDGGVKPQDLGNPLVPVRVQLQFDFYLPGGKKTSESITYQINDLTPEGNPALMVKIPKLQEKYGKDMYMLDLHTGYLYQIHNSSGGFQPVEERGYLHPTESMWADMNEVAREEYLRVNDLNRELQQEDKSDQSKVTSTPLLHTGVSKKTDDEKTIKGLGEGEGLSPIIKELSAPKKPPRIEEVSKLKPIPTPRPRTDKIDNEGQNEAQNDNTPSIPAGAKPKEESGPKVIPSEVPKTPMPTTPLNIDPIVLNRRRSEMMARLPKDVDIPATTASPLQLIEDEEYYLRKLREVQEAKIRVVSLRRQHNLMGYGPEITEYIGPIYEEKQRRFEQQEILIKKIIIKIHQLKDKWCYPIIFPLTAIPSGTTEQEQMMYYENERVLCETLRRATSEIYQRRIKTYNDPKDQEEEINRWKQWIAQITLKEKELAEKMKEIHKGREPWDGGTTDLEAKDMSVDDTSPTTPAQQVLQDNANREHSVPGIVYSREVSRTNSTSRPTDDEARQSQEEAIELVKKICSVTEDEEPYSEARRKEEKNKKNLVNSREFVENVRRRTEKVTPRRQDERNSRKRIRNYTTNTEEALRAMIEEQTEKLVVEREEMLKRFIQEIQQGMQNFSENRRSSDDSRRRRGNEQEDPIVEVNKGKTDMRPPRPPPPQTYQYRNPIFDLEQKFGEEVTPINDQSQTTKTYLLDETKEEPTPVRVDYDPKYSDKNPNVSFPVTLQPKQTRYEESVEPTSETELKRTHKKGERERENNYPGNTTAENTQSVPIVSHAGGGSDPPGPGGGPGKGPPDNGSGGDRDYRRRRQNDNGRDPGRDPGDDPSDPSDDSPEDENPRRRRRIKKRIYLVQGPPGPPGKDGKDGKDKIPVDGKTNEDGAGGPKLATALNALATSLTKFGDGIAGVANEQAGFNKHLEEQIINQNKHLTTQENTMTEMLIANKRAMYNEAFAAIPVFEGTSRAEFEDWLESIEILCEISGRDVRTEILNRGGIVVKRVIRSIPPKTPWEEQKAELRREFSVLQSKAHAAKVLEELRQKPGETMRPYIQKYKMLHNTITGREPEAETDASHIIRFLSSLQNVSIKRKISERGIPDGMTLAQVFTKAMAMEAGLQYSDRVVDDSAIGQVLNVEKGQIDALEDQRQPIRGRTNPITCWTCGEHGHFQRECPLLKHHDGDNRRDGDTGTSTMYHTIFGRNEVPNKFLSQIYRQLAAETFKKRIYKAGLAQANKSTASTTATNPTTGTRTASQPVAQQNFTLTTDPTLTTNTIPKTSTTDFKPVRIPRGVTDAKEYIKNLADRARGSRGRGGRSNRGRSDGHPRMRDNQRSVNYIDVMEKLAEISDDENGEDSEVTEEEMQELQEIIETLPPGHDLFEDLNSEESA